MLHVFGATVTAEEADSLSRCLNVNQEMWGVLQSHLL